VSRDGQVSSYATAAEALAARAAGGYVWVDLVNPAREDLQALAEPFGLHPLAIEDCLDDEQVPKIEDFPGNTFVLFNRHHFSDGTLHIEEIDFFIGQGFLVTVSAHAETRGARARLDEAIRIDQAGVGKGPDFLLHVILDYIVDGKLLAIEALQDDLDTAEEDALRRKSAAFDPAGLLEMRRSLLALRKSLFHEREILIKICRRDSPFISEASIFRFRDIYDHLVKFVEIIEDLLAAGDSPGARQQRTRATGEPHQPGGSPADVHHDHLHAALVLRRGWRHVGMEHDDRAAELADRVSGLPGGHGGVRGDQLLHSEVARPPGRTGGAMRQAAEAAARPTHIGTPNARTIDTPAGPALASAESAHHAPASQGVLIRRTH
jgi:Mg2+ and Co2+ transporter CorA